MPKFAEAGAAALALTLTLSGQSLAQTVPDLPVSIMCYAEADHSWRVGYLSRVDQNGDAQYVSAAGKLSATLNSKGVLESPTNRPGGVDCYGKTLAELRAKNRTLDFHPQK
jgi:hypothetical protein